MIPRLLRVVVCFGFLAVVPAVAGAAIQTPEQFLGHRVGADGKLADYGQITRYFEQLDQGSDRLTVVKLGPTTLDRTMFMAVISSEANLRNLERQKQIARRLADPRGLPEAEAERLIAEGRTIVLVTCNIHANEIGASQMAMEWAHQLVTSDDPQVKQRLDDVILLLMPSINPDGTDMIVDYYRKYAGTPWEGGRLPWLYHHYAGHDNNRDWYMLNLRETRMVNRVLHHEWFPQVFLDEHQMGGTGPRIFVPPYADPLTTAVHPLQWRLNDVVGTNMALRLEQRKKSGVIYGYSFDAYWPGGTKNTACLKNVIGLLTEVSSCRIASPIWVDRSELVGGRKGLPEYRAQINFPNPWPGGWWRLRDIVDYELIASNSLLETCSRNRTEILQGLYQMATQAVSDGATGPYAYVVPARQHDAHAAARMVDILREGGLEAHRARGPITTADGRTWPAGSIVFLAAQPFRPFLIEMMERQRYPEVRPSTESKDIYRPYDVTAWTLPLLMGVDWARVDQRFDADLEKLEATPWPAGGVTGSGSAALLIDGSTHQAAKVVNALLAKRVKVERATREFGAGGRAWAPGTFVVAAGAASDADRAGRDAHVEVHRVDTMPDVPRVALTAPRIGIYKPWAASMDEGWTRLVFDNAGFAYTQLDNAAIKAGRLNAKYDVIVLADIDKPVIVDGKPRADDGGGAYFEPLPPPYAGGIGKEGVAALKAFVEAGGTVVAFSDACDLPIDEFGIPVRNTAARLKSSDYSVPGSLLNVDVDPTHPLAWGMPEHIAVYHTGGPVLATNVPGANVGRSIAGRFVAAKEDVVASGWVAGEEYLAGRPALVEAALGKGRVVLFGFRPQQRAQTVGTYPLVFNALYRSTEK